MDNKSKLEKNGKKLNDKVEILSFFDPHARPAKKEDHTGCCEPKPDPATIETPDKRRLKYEKKFPKEKQDAIKSLINIDE